MAHGEQLKFVGDVKELHPLFFKNKRVVEFGSLDINGSTRKFFEDCEYIGVDLAEGKGVDVVSIAHEFETGELFDVVVSMNALEHDYYWKKTLQKAMDVLKSGGMLLISVSHSHREHGTLEYNPKDSPFTTKAELEKWRTFYKNFDMSDLDEILKPSQNFYRWQMRITGHDLQFWGTKK